MAKVWDRVCVVVNKLMHAHKMYGFAEFKEGMNPGLDVVLKFFSIIEDTLTILVDSGQLSYDEARQSLNSKQCILYTRQLSVALDNGDQTEYLRLINLLDEQAKI